MSDNGLFSKRPSNIDAEKSILGAIMLENQLCHQAVDLLGEGGELFLESHKRIFRKMILLTNNGSPIDLITLTATLEKTNELEQAGGATYISGLIDGVPRTDTIAPYVALVKEAARGRKLQDVARDILANIRDGEPVAEVLEKAEQGVFEIGEHDRQIGGARHVGEIAAQLADFYEQKTADKSRLIGLSTGYIDLDKRTSGLPIGVTIIAGRPGMAKTATAINISCNVASEGRSVYYYSPESSAEQIVQRVLASESRIDSLRMREGRMIPEEWRKLSETLMRLAITRFVVDDTVNLKMEALLSRLRQYKISHGLDLLVVDYIQVIARRLVDGKRFTNLRSAVQFVSAFLVEISRVLRIPVLALAQLGRDVDTRTDHRPTMGDLQESSSLEQDAELVLLLLREEKYKRTDANKGILKIIFGKFRDGSTREDLEMAFIEEYTRMEPLWRD